MLHALFDKARSWFFPSPDGGWDRYLAEIAAIRTASSTARERSFARTLQAIRDTLRIEPFDVQLLGALVMAEGHLAEMQTGEGKTLTAVFTASWLAAQGTPVHVLTANDYLARRDAEWMGPVYHALGLQTGWLSQSLDREQRRTAYAADILYATAHEVGFDYLRDGLALHPEGRVQRGFAAALIDEADSILIDEARIPLILAGAAAPPEQLARRLAQLARSLHAWEHFMTDAHGRMIHLTDAGAARIESSLDCGSLYDERNLALFTAVIDAIHAHALLRRDVDYLVRDGAIQIIDEHKGRVARLRRWPAGLQTALEAKEGLALRPQARILGSITLQSLARQYEFLCGMTGTALTQAQEFAEVYRLAVIPVPTNRPVIRRDAADRVYATRADRDRALAAEIRKAHATGRPVLVGTASVADSEALSALLDQAAIPHQVLNARNDAAEAGIIAHAGERGAVTVSTNMAGRGTDIRLGAGVAEWGGLYVIGACRHEARRIDHQLRGRAGRQGDPGESCFFLSLQDDLMRRYGLESMLHQAADPGLAMDHIQRVIEGEHLQLRKTLLKYDALIDNQRAYVQSLRNSLLDGERPCEHPDAALRKIDELWSDYLASVAELKSGIHFVSFGGRNPLDDFLHRAQQMFEQIEQEMLAAIDDPAAAELIDAIDRGATWTYITTDEPLGDLNQRIARGIVEKLRLLFAPR